MRSVGATAPENTVASIWSMSRSRPATTGAYPSTTWSRIAYSAAEVANLGQLLLSRLEQPEPYEAALPAPGGCLLQRHRALVTPAAVQVMSAIDDHLGKPPCRQPGQTPATSIADHGLTTNAG